MGVPAVIEIRVALSAQVPGAMLGTILRGKGEEERLVWRRGRSPAGTPLAIEELRRIRRKRRCHEGRKTVMCIDKEEES